MIFINSFLSEWLKRRRSSAVWLTLFGGLFVPLIMLTSRLIRHKSTILANASEGIWEKTHNDIWQYMAYFLLPMGITLAASLITQIEFRNNTWKQTLTTPQSLSTVFWAKYLVVLIMLLQFFILLNIGIILAVFVPALVYGDVPFPKESYPFLPFLKGNAKLFVCILPVLALQYLLSLHIRNFIIPIVIGFGLTIAALIGINWEYGHWIPYTYAPYQFMGDKMNGKFNFYYWSIGYFSFFTLINYLLFSLPKSLQSKDFPMLRFISKRNLKVGALILVGITIFSFFFVKNKSKNSAKLTTTIEQRISDFEENLGLIKFKINNEQALGVAARMKNYGIKGMSIAVINDYKIEWAKSYGWADEAQQKPMTNETLFTPGSISKSFNALAIMRLYQEKQLDIFEDINRYLTSWQFPYDEKTKSKKITLAHLLSHSAGLNIHGFGFESYRLGDSLPTTLQIVKGEKPAKNEAVRSLFAPGERFEYSGGGTILSQLVVEDLTKLNYTQFMQEKVLQPLGMTNSFFNQPPPSDKAALLSTGYSMMYDGKALPYQYPVQPELAAAGLWTTASDLAKMVINVQNALKNEPNTLLLQNIAELMMTPYNDEAEKAAMGFFIDNFKGTKYFQHAAGNPGFSGKFIGSMTGGKGLVILVNSDDDAAIFEEVTQCIADIYQWEGFETKPTPTLKNSIAIAENDLDNYAGAYRYQDNVFLVQKNNNSLYFKFLDKNWKLYFEDKNHAFNMESKSEKSFIFQSNGKADTLKIKDEKGNLKIAYRVNPIMPSDVELEGYVGEYIEKSEEIAKIELKNHELWINSPNATKPMKAHFLTFSEFYLDIDGGIYVIYKDAVKNKGGEVILRRR